MDKQQSRSTVASILVSVLMASLCSTAHSMAEEAPPNREPASVLADALEGARHPLRLVEGRLEGPGAGVLTEAAHNARHVLIGEDHGIAEILTFSEALFRAVQPFGYGTYVTEVGPMSARHLNRLATSRDGLTAFDTFYNATPFAIPFATYEEEARLLRTVAAQSSLTEPIWGIDQEFVLSPQRLLVDLAERTDDEAIRAQLALLRDREREAFRAIVAAGNPEAAKMFMSAPLPDAWPAIRAHFRDRDDREALESIDALAASHTVYGHFFAQRFHHNNADRARLMKRQLAAYFARLGDERQLFVKMGANHVGRGHSTLGIADIGNLLAELAELNDTESLHVLVLARAGERNGWLPFLPEAASAMPIDLSSPGYRSVGSLVDLPSTTMGWHLFDLRSLRPQHAWYLQHFPAFASLLLRYDMAVMIDRGHPATLFQGNGFAGNPDSVKAPEAR